MASPLATVALVFMTYSPAEMPNHVKIQYLAGNESATVQACIAKTEKINDAIDITRQDAGCTRVAPPSDNVLYIEKALFHVMADRYFVTVNQ